MKARFAHAIREGILFARQDFGSDDYTPHIKTFKSWRDGQLFTHAYFVTTYRLIDDAKARGDYDA